MSATRTTVRGGADVKTGKETQDGEADEAGQEERRQSRKRKREKRQNVSRCVGGTEEHRTRPGKRGRGLKQKLTCVDKELKI